ncbi:MAG: energy transducer TonB [Methylomonas sp.]|nr:energy transducer TonB [Methylomonas sp.]
MADVKPTESRGKYLSGLASMLIGPLFVFGTVLLMNRVGDGIDKNDAQDSTQLTVIKQPKPEAQKEVTKPKPKPKPKQVRAPMPAAMLNANLSGIDLGLSNLGGSDLNVGDNSLLGNTQASVMTEDSVDVMPQPKVRGNFIYPKAAKKQGVEGYVVLSVLIDTEGRVDKVKVLESSPQGVFDDSAMEGVKSWQFTPAQYQGKTVKVWAKQKIRFGLG